MLLLNLVKNVCGCKVQEGFTGIIGVNNPRIINSGEGTIYSCNQWINQSAQDYYNAPYPCGVDAIKGDYCDFLKDCGAESQLDDLRNYWNSMLLYGAGSGECGPYGNLFTWDNFKLAVDNAIAQDNSIPPCPAPTPVVTYSWQAEDFPDCPTACGTEQLTQERTVTCMDSDGNVAANSSCTEEEPAATNTCPATALCFSSYSDWNPSSCPGFICPMTPPTTRTREYICRDGNGNHVSLGRCEEPAEETTETCIQQVRNCVNDGTCVNGVCSCPEGFSGENCEININDCTESSCQNGGTCIDGVNMFTCQCVNGYTGDNCETDPNPCEYPVHVECGQHGDCFNGKCACNDGYTGDNCDTLIVNCEGSYGDWSPCSLSPAGCTRTKRFNAINPACCNRGYCPSPATFQCPKGSCSGDSGGSSTVSAVLRDAPTASYINSKLTEWGIQINGQYCNIQNPPDGCGTTQPLGWQVSPLRTQSDSANNRLEIASINCMDQILDRPNHDPNSCNNYCEIVMEREDIGNNRPGLYKGTISKGKVCCNEDKQYVPLIFDQNPPEGSGQGWVYSQSNAELCGTSIITR